MNPTVLHSAAEVACFSLLTSIAFILLFVGIARLRRYRRILVYGQPGRAIVSYIKTREIRTRKNEEDVIKTVYSEVVEIRLLTGEHIEDSLCEKSSLSKCHNPGDRLSLRYDPEYPHYFVIDGDKQLRNQAFALIAFSILVFITACAAYRL